MTHHTWTNRFLPPLVFIGVVGCVWYGLSSRPKTPSVLPAPQVVAAAKAPTTDSLQPIAAVSPTVDKLDGAVQFSINAKPFSQIQKVEFYIEDKFIGAAFAQPYVVRVDEDALSAGTHSVTAKVYTVGSTAQTTPTLFVAAPKILQQDTPADEDVTPPVSAPGSTVPQPSTSAVDSPTNLTVVATTDGTQAELSWSAVAAAASYQVWRDGTQIGATTQTTYIDTALTPGQTYDYAIIAVDSVGTASAPSAQVGVTMSMEQNAIPKPPADTNAAQKPQDSNVADESQT